MRKNFSNLINTGNNFIYNCLSKTKSLDVANAISLFCDPRGGSTWLAETLSTIKKTIILDEPLYLGNSTSFRDLGFTWRQDIPENMDWPEARHEFLKVLSGKVMDASLCSESSILNILLANRVILKIIRGKLLLPWYVKQFEFINVPIVLIRHPLAVISSMLQHPGWNYPFKPYEPTYQFQGSVYEKYNEYLSSLKTKEELLLAYWCISNNYLLNHPFNNIRWITVFYEHLLVEKKVEVKRIFERWGIEIPNDLMIKIFKPSTTVVGKKEIIVENQLNGWRECFSKERMLRLRKVLDYFEVDYYGEEEFPNISFK